MSTPATSLIDRYARQLVSLLPPGRALSKALGSTIGKMLTGLAVEFARVHERSQDMQREVVPGDADELLPEWEQATGLPDCGNPTTTEGRQQALVSKLVARGDQSDSTFAAIGEALGYQDVQLSHAHLPATCTSPCNTSVANIEWAFTKEVTADGSKQKYDTLKCRMRQHAHLYGVLVFDSTVLGAQRTDGTIDTLVTQSGDRLLAR
jgi:uncharacterized protein YmfQ (DUF2313 family)